ncbi:BTB/POZ protein [Leptodontidium sp. 2 PMI_412]|nr:BTB/POZ protein [Leptodontidium sp. 2 PMI_412]
MIGFIIIIFFVLWLCDVPVTPWFWTYWRRMTNWWPTKATNKDSKDQARRRRTFLAKNACLLSSGEFSDVTVSCSGQTWNLHRVVICPRCRYFQNTFGGKFQEAETGLVELDDDVDPKNFNHIVRYLYHGNCDWDVLQNENGNIYVACLELSLMADYFGIDDLILDISAYIRGSCKHVVEGLQKGWHEHGEARSLPADFLEKFIDGARITFSDKNPDAINPLRQAFVQFVADTRYLVLRNNSFRQALSDVPEFAAAILGNVFADGSPFYKLTCIGLPESCGNCRKQGRTFTATWIGRLGEIDGICSDCRGMD